MKASHLRTIKIPTPHQKERRAEIDLIVIHAMAEWVIENGRFYHCTDFLQRIGLSVHALCLPDGRIVETVDPNRVAFHAKACNENSIGIEFIVEGAHDLNSLVNRMENEKKSPYKKRQYRNGGKWIREWATVFGLSFRNVTTHSVLDPENKKDPGKAFDMSAIEMIMMK